MRALSPSPILRLRHCVCFWLAMIGGGLCSHAGHAQESTASLRPCVLLKNDNVLFGRARQVGEYIFVSTGPGDELKLSREQVACWADSLLDLYRYRLDHRSETDLQAHLIDARWCIQHELFDQAGNEIEFAKAIAPRNREIQVLEDLLQRRRRSVAALLPTPPTIATTQFLQTAFSIEPGVSESVDSRTLAGFASRVQPTLINRCGRCHQQDSPLQWRLHVPPSGTRLTARLTRENLRATLAFVDHSNPAASSILIKATSPHGGTDAPLTARNAGAIEALRQWLAAAQTSSMRRSNDQDQSSNAKPHARVDQPEAEIAQVAYDEPVDQRISSATAETAKPIDPQRLPTVANPFDASLFNRKYHRDAP